jgi:hypothetical protein
MICDCEGLLSGWRGIREAVVGEREGHEARIARPDSITATAKFQDGHISCRPTSSFSRRFPMMLFERCSAPMRYLWRSPLRLATSVRLAQLPTNAALHSQLLADGFTLYLGHYSNRKRAKDRKSIGSLVLPSSARSANAEPSAGVNLKPWPDKPAANTTCG